MNPIKFRNSNLVRPKLGDGCLKLHQFLLVERAYFFCSIGLFLSIASHFPVLPYSLVNLSGYPLCCKACCCLCAGRWCHSQALHWIGLSIQVNFKTCCSFFHFFAAYIASLVNVVLTEIELVDIQDCSGLGYELVMLPQWPILSKAVVYVFPAGSFNTKIFLLCCSTNFQSKLYFLVTWIYWRQNQILIFFIQASYM